MTRDGHIVAFLCVLPRIHIDWPRSREVRIPLTHILLPLRCILLRVATNTGNPKAGIKHPTVQSLRSWKKAAGGLCQEGFEALREIFQTSDVKVNARHVSMNFLMLANFMALKKESPTAQALAIHMLGRSDPTLLFCLELGGESVGGGIVVVDIHISRSTPRVVR